MRLQKLLGVWQAAHARLQPLPPQIDGPHHYLALAQTKIVQRGSKLTAHRHRHFRRCSRCGCALVGSEIAQRRVGFVAHSADHGNRRFGHGAHHRFLVKAPQILDRSAPARHDQQVRAWYCSARLQRAKAAHGGCNLVGRTLPLHQHRPHDDMGRKTILQPVQNITNHCAGGRRHHTDDLGCKGQAADIAKQPFGFETLAVLLQ